MEVHKPFVSPSIITGQLASLWFSTTAMGASQGATSDVLSKVTPQEHRLLPRNPFPWSVRVIMMSVPEHHPLFHMSLSWWHRFSWDLNQLSQMRQRRRRGPTKLCRCLIAPYELIPSKCPIYSMDIYWDFHRGVMASAYCFWLVPAEHIHLLMNNEKQCNVAMPQKQWENRCTGPSPQQPLIMIRGRHHIFLTVYDSFSVNMEWWNRQQCSQSGHSRLIR